MASLAEVVIPFCVINHYTPTILDFVCRMLYAGWPRATVNKDQVEVLIRIAINKGDVTPEGKATKAHIP